MSVSLFVYIYVCVCVDMCVCVSVCTFCSRNTYTVIPNTVCDALIGQRRDLVIVRYFSILEVVIIFCELRSLLPICNCGYCNTDKSSTTTNGCRMVES